MDSTRRREAQLSFAPGEHEAQEEWLDTREYDHGFMSEVLAHDIVALLRGRLDPDDQVILDALTDGMGACEISTS